MSAVISTASIKPSTLTLEQDPASVSPEALDRYFPAEQRVQTTALDPEY